MKIETNEINRLIQMEYTLHPASRLTDYYKLFFQAIYGPGHLITNNEAAYQYLIDELQNFQENQEPLIQDLSFAGNDFCRVNLQVITLNMLDVRTYCRHFIRSADNLQSSIDLREIWSVITELLEEMGILGETFNEEMKLLGSFTEGVDLISPRHSESFRNAYDPHYRLIRKEFITNLL